MPDSTLRYLYNVIEQRRSADPATSYVAKLFQKGPQKIAQKVGEEAVETVLAASGGKQDNIISESADLVFHLMVLWSAHRITPEQVLAELKRREGTSGIEEKRARQEFEE